jgi:hypothetical protein
MTTRKHYQLELGKLFDCELKSRAEMEASIPADQLGWWHDVCPGKVIKLRQATESDIQSNWFRSTASRNPDDYMIEHRENGRLVHKNAIKSTYARSQVPLAETEINDRLGQIRKELSANKEGA